MKWVIIALVMLFLAPKTHGDLSQSQKVTLLEEAQSAYDRGVDLTSIDRTRSRAAFTTAVDRFSLVVASGVENGQLYYDLGNAYVQAGSLGAAIASYRRAQRLLPGDGRIEANLRYARSEVKPQIPPHTAGALMEVVLFWHTGLSMSAKAIWLAAAWLTLWLLVLAHRFASIPGLWWAVTAAGIVTVGMGGSLAIEVSASQGTSSGVVVSDGVIVRKGNGASYAPQFQEPINQGLEFEVLDQRPDWLLIELPDGTSGWIPTIDTELLTVGSNSGTTV
jgi:tetratricopeptide (TPR) repeat protein